MWGYEKKAGVAAFFGGDCGMRRGMVWLNYNLDFLSRINSVISIIYDVF